MPGAVEVSQEPLSESHCNSVLLGGPAEQPQCRQGFAMAFLRFEDGDHLPCEGLDVSGMAQF